MNESKLYIGCSTSIYCRPEKSCFSYKLHSLILNHMKRGNEVHNLCLVLGGQRDELQKKGLSLRAASLLPEDVEHFVVEYSAHLDLSGLISGD